jgi:hypothetical protein
MKMFLDSVKGITNSGQLDLSFGSFRVDNHGVEKKVFITFFQKSINNNSDLINDTDEFISDFVKTDQLGILFVVSYY